MKLVPATEFTLQELADAYNQTRLDYIVPMPMTVERLRDYIETYDINMGASCAAVDEEEELILGIGMLGVRHDRAWITRLGVLPYARRLGTGQAIMEYLIGQAQGCHCSRLWLEVIKGNTPAHALFEKLGFVETRELIVSRRPPQPLSENSPPKEIKAITMLDKQLALKLLRQRTNKPNWLNETESFENVANLTGLLISLSGGRQGFIVYESSLLQLKRLVVEPLRGDVAEVSELVLRTLHTLSPMQDAVSENIPVDDPRWQGYAAVGYFDGFHRIEMVKDMTKRP